ncbi:unnamed protein product [Ranitomeya imitator]|uniref:Uncharacterized protein n=1 Tax=Ranitomeya imitator TaxID=111125 RepID=A0ABN9MBK1_9NEOB|nr:unnamed protein product [Ranitomeya imitator]
MTIRVLGDRGAVTSAVGCCARILSLLKLVGTVREDSSSNVPPVLVEGHLEYEVGIIIDSRQNNCNLQHLPNQAEKRQEHCQPEYHQHAKHMAKHPNVSGSQNSKRRKFTDRHIVTPK